MINNNYGEFDMGLTIREIAARAGVSAATVSRVVNGTGAVAPEKREQVLAVLGEQQAAPRRRRSANAAGKTLGVLMLPGSESDPRVIVNKLSAITEKLPRKWSLQLLSSEILPLELEARHLRGELAGLIIAGHGGCAPELGRVFARIPHVWLNSHRLADEGQTVLMGNEFAGRLAARYLIERGCRKIGVVGGCADALQEGRAGAGADFFRAALQKAGLAADSRNAVACEDSQEAAYRAVLERLKKEPDAFDGLIVHNINKVFGCCRAVGDAGLSIPGQVKVATISDLALCRLYSVPLTVWAQPVPEICRALVDLTLARLREPDAPCRTVKFHSTLLARESTQPTHERK